MSIDGSVFINPMTMCSVEIELTNAEHETITQTVKLGYYRSKLNKALMEHIDALLKMPDDADVEAVKPILYPAFLQLVGWWNIKRGEEMWPLTAEAIEPMDPFYIGALLFGILNQNRKSAQGEAARGPSAQPLSPATSEAAANTTTASAPKNSNDSIISLSQKASRRSSPGNGSKRRLTTMKTPMSGSKRKSG